MADTFKDNLGHRKGKHHKRGCNHSGKKNCDWCERRLRIASIRLAVKAKDEIKDTPALDAYYTMLEYDPMDCLYDDIEFIIPDDSYDYYRGYGSEDAH